MDEPRAAGSLKNHSAVLAGSAAIAAIMAVLATRTGPDRSPALADAAWVLLTSGPWAAGWILAAAGLGRPLRRLLLGPGPSPAIVQIGLGAAVLMTLDAALGSLGVLQWGGSIGAWALIAAGFALLLPQARGLARGLPLPPFLTWTMAPAVAVLLLAACSAPGWLWSSEFGGYDAMSYHLQLPGEWLALGRIAPLDHNVYSYLPGYVEAAYYHLAVLMGDGLSAVYACQLLHAGLVLLTAAAVGHLAARHGGPVAGAAAAVFLAGTPWTIVVGSLGYNEMAVCLFLATGLVILDERPMTARRAAALGVLAAAACGAKLTGAGLAAIPLVLLLLSAAPPRRFAALLGAAAGAALLCLLPSLVRNWVFAGNPVFPFATGIFGTGHWTGDQARIWLHGHVAVTGAAERLSAAWNELFRYGIGPTPSPREPWMPQWSVLPWLALGGLALQLATGRRGFAGRLGLILAAQLLFWMLATHVKSRFLLPAVVPFALSAGMGLGILHERARSSGMERVFLPAAALAFLLWCCAPAALFLRERQGAPAAMIGWADALSGDRLTEQDRAAAAESIAAVMINYGLPPGSRTLLVGEATPLYYHLSRIAYQTTWDRGPLSAAMERSPDAPQEWMHELRREGFTHLLVNPVMLELWELEGWNDPHLTAGRVVDAAERFATPVRRFPDGVVLYRIPDG